VGDVIAEVLPGLPTSAICEDARRMHADGLTDRQREVVALIVAGYPNMAISRELGISVRTVRAHIDAVRYKLGVNRRNNIPLAYLSRVGVISFAEMLSDHVIVTSSAID